MSDIPHIAYNGESKVIRRLCQSVNALADGGGGGGADVTAAISALSERIDALQDTVGVTPGLTASVENGVLILTGSGAAVKSSRLVLVSNSVSVSGNAVIF